MYSLIARRSFPFFLSGSGEVADFQEFTASGTWTKPSGYGANSYALLEAWGAGGSGARNTTATSCSGGGGGGYSSRWVKLSAMSGTETITIGAGGASRTGSNQNGATGGNTTIGSLLTAYGGGGGGSAAGAVGGSGGGQMSAGSINSISPGLPLFTSSGDGYYQGGGVNQTDSTVNAAYIHGGGGGYASATASWRNGAGSVWGGGGGAGHSGGTGGSSVNGGAGGASAATGTAGTQPGGGGGSGTTTSGAGADGMARITVFKV